jgi:hypothetical protein
MRAKKCLKCETVYSDDVIGCPECGSPSNIIVDVDDAAPKTETTHAGENGIRAAAPEPARYDFGRRFLLLTVVLAAAVQVASYLLLEYVVPDRVGMTYELPRDYTRLGRQHLMFSAVLVVIGLAVWGSAKRATSGEIRMFSFVSDPSSRLRNFRGLLRPLPIAFLAIAIAAGVFAVELLQPDWSIVTFHAGEEDMADYEGRPGVFTWPGSTQVVRVERGLVDSDLYRVLHNVGYSHAGDAADRHAGEERTRKRWGIISVIVCGGALAAAFLKGLRDPVRPGV